MNSHVTACGTRDAAGFTRGPLSCESEYCLMMIVTGQRSTAHTSLTEENQTNMSAAYWTLFMLWYDKWCSSRVPF